MRPTVYLTIVALVLLSAQAQAQQAAMLGPWERISDSDGIQTFRRGPADGQLEFLGRAVVPADPWRTMAALLDEAHATDWVYHCVQAQVLAHPAPLHWITYRRNIAGAPFVADRDMVLATTLSQAPGEPTLRLAFGRLVDDAAWPVPRGVVRVTAIAGHFDCTPVGPDQTQVAYTVAVDPGGKLPHWLRKRATAELPRLTLSGLRRAVLAPHLGPLASAVAAELAQAAAVP